MEANKPIRKTLRPCPEESVDWDHTENLYIEGDNLEVLKLLQECYLGKVKMIYIDPPYNTGNDFIYRDDFALGAEEYAEEAGVYDEDENRLFKNTDSNGRFHSDWCSMMYSRLMLARNMLSENGVIFISIDDNELESLKNCCDEVFGLINFIGVFVIKSNPRGSMSTAEIASLHEYVLVYAKNRAVCVFRGESLSEDMSSEYKYEDSLGKYRLMGLRMRGGFWRRSERPNLYFPIYINPESAEVSLIQSSTFCEEAYPIQPSSGEDGTWRWGREKIESDKNMLIGKQVTRDGELVWDVYQKDYLQSNGCARRTKARSIWDDKELNYQNGTIEIKELFNKGGIFEYSKPVFLIRKLMDVFGTEKDELILDFFSGSATTAHAVMQLNAEDGGNRKFIMVQLPEACDEKSEAYKSGYKNICEIGKERIRRAGTKIKADSPLTTQELDTGFRVFKLDDTNMKDVYYAAGDYEQWMLSRMESNIKEDRTDLDLLFGCLLEWGLPLSLPYTSKEIDGCTVHTYNDGDLIACFDENIPDSVVKTIARRQPLRAVFRDSSFADSPSKINVGEIFKLLAPDTRVKVI